MREKRRGKPKIPPPKKEDMMRSNLFKYALSQEQTFVAFEMWERLDRRCESKVPREEILALCQNFPGRDGPEELLKHLSWDKNEMVNKNEWMRFIRRTKQIEGDDGLDEVPSPSPSP